MKTCFSAGKLMKQFGTPPPPPSTNPPISEQFFHDSPLCSNFKNQKRPLILGGEETMNKFNQNCANLLIYEIIPTKCKFVIYFHKVPVAPVASFWCLYC